MMESLKEFKAKIKMLLAQYFNIEEDKPYIQVNAILMNDDEISVMYYINVDNYKTKFKFKSNGTLDSFNRCLKRLKLDLEQQFHPEKMDDVLVFEKENVIPSTIISGETPNSRIPDHGGMLIQANEILEQLLSKPNEVDFGRGFGPAVREEESDLSIIGFGPAIRVEESDFSMRGFNKEEEKEMSTKPIPPTSQIIKEGEDPKPKNT